MSTATETLLQVYGQATLPRLARGAGLDESEPGRALEALSTLYGDKSGRARVVAGLPLEARELLAFIDGIGRRLRGERLKKRWFLHGYTDFDARIEPLVEAGLVIVGNVGAREPVALETALEQGLLQQWIQVTPGFEHLAGDPPPALEVVEQFDDETTLEVHVRTGVLEYNLLAAARFAEGHRIRLNRDGSPHRSDLKAMAPRIIDRHGGGSEHLIDPNSVEGWDLLVFLLSIGDALGMIERREESLRARPQGFEYFRRPLHDRLHSLTRALESQRAWSEVHAAVWQATGEPPITGQGDGGFLAEGGPGSGLGGARGSILSALRRLAPHDWFNVEDTVVTIGKLETQYLATVLPTAADEVGIHAFVRAFLTQTMVHVGAIERGRGGDGTTRARLTPIGRAMLGIGEAPPEPTGHGALVVQPTYEVTCYLDHAPLRLLHDLSRFAETMHTSERIVSYRLSGESVQWGYARGYTADAIEHILSSSSARTIPSSVSFALQDWERLHRRVTVLIAGEIVAAGEKVDPEMIQSGVQFAINVEQDIEIIDFVHTFVVAGHKEALDRALNAHKPRIIDYNGPIQPSLFWIDEQTLRAPMGATDLRLLARLHRFCETEDDESFRISPPRIRTHFGMDDGLHRLITLLREGMVGGLSAERELQLKQLLGEPARGSVQPMEVLLLASADDGDRVARVTGLKDFIAQRLGPRAFQVVPGTLARLTAVLRDLGVAFDDG